MIGNISGAQGALNRLLSASAASSALSSTTSGGAAQVGAATRTGASGTAAAQDLQSFMSSLIQELRQSGAAAGSVAQGASHTGVSSTHHGHGGGHRVSNQLESMLAQLQGDSSNSTGASAVASIANTGTQNSAGNSMQASFQRLMQDLKAAPGAGQLVRTSA